MIITKIERQKKVSSRRSIFLDEKFAFGISDDVLLKFSLYEGQELTEEEISEITKAETEFSVKSAALRFRSYRPRSTKEVKEYLQKKGFDESMIATTIEFLAVNSLLNDEEFARMYCRDRLHLKPIGKLAMQQQLFKKGIPKEHIQKIILEFYSHDVEKELATKEAEKKYKRSRSLPPLTIKRRVYEHLIRHGYDSSLSRSIVNQLVK
ncbi:MAG: RecX family transcriptional regulator [Bacteroidota bacterium]|nr:RecX family transcriptional regulator [Bacteroidota bacterium]